MRFSVSHETIYRYATPVWLSTHALRLTPRPDAGALGARELIVEPAPVQRREAIDAFGNLVIEVDFAGASDILRILSRFEIDVAPPPSVKTNPPALPWAPDAALAPYLAEPSPHESVHDFAARLADAAGGSALTFLDRLNQALYADIRHDIRDNGAARAPAQTLALGHGACRDVTLLFLAACRSLGVPARFVSGYQAEADAPDGRRHLHAWPQAWLPGFGWRGYDPTHGVGVADGHVALCAAPTQGPTMPVQGGYFGAAVASTLSYEVQIKAG